MLKSKMRFYLAGRMTGVIDPVTGRPNYNAPKFARTKQLVESLGHVVISPHDLNEEIWYAHHQESWDPIRCRADYGDSILRHMFLRDLEVILTNVDGIVVLNDWLTSKGSNIELGVANMFHIPLYRLVEYEHSGAIELVRATELEGRYAWLESIDSEVIPETLQPIQPI